MTTFEITNIQDEFIEEGRKNADAGGEHEEMLKEEEESESKKEEEEQEGVEVEDVAERGVEKEVRIAKSQWISFGIERQLGFMKMFCFCSRPFGWPYSVEQFLKWSQFTGDNIIQMFKI